MPFFPFFDIFLTFQCTFWNPIDSFFHILFFHNLLNTTFLLLQHASLLIAKAIKTIFYPRALYQNLT